MKNKILLFTILAFLVSACDFEIKCLDCTTETITFKTSEEKKKVNEALGVLNELFDESFEKSNIEKIIPMQDNEGKPLLKILKFKKKGYALISDIKNVDNPAVLFFSKSKFDKDHPGFKVYVEEFKATAARDTINAILPSSESFRTKFRELFKEQKLSSNSRGESSNRGLPSIYYQDIPYDYLPWFIKQSKSTCYDKDGNLKAFCSRYCNSSRYANCSYNNCGGGICYKDDDYSGQNQYIRNGKVRLKTPRVKLKNGYYRTSRYLGRHYKGIVEKKGPLLLTAWKQGTPYVNTRKNNPTWKSTTAIGCGPVAVGQIMAYHKKSKFKWPGDYDYWKHIYQTNLFEGESNNVIYSPSIFIPGSDRIPGEYYVKNKEKDESPISKLLNEIADEVIWWPVSDDDQMASDERCAYYLEDSGYTVSGWRWWFFGWHYEANDYSYDDVVREIDCDRPVYLSGWAGINKAHIWVADGYAKSGYVHRYEKSNGYYSYGTKSDTNTNTQEYIDGIDVKMIHMNWGWGSQEENKISDGVKGGWCTYDYWLVPNGDKVYGWGDMITVKP